jgi:hypothetical protein
MDTGGLLDGKVEELFVNRGQAIVFCSSSRHAGGSNYSINQTGMYIIYLRILFHWNQIILIKLEQGSNIEA